MKIIIYILLFLLIISIANNYVLHYYQKKEEKNISSQTSNFLVEPTKLPNNVGILTLYIFYNKDRKYEKCHQLDNISNNNSFDDPSMLVNIKKNIEDIYKTNNNKCYIVKKNNNELIDLNKYLDKAIKKIN
jgi:amino acid permease